MPSVLPVYQDADAQETVASNAQIENKSDGPVKVTGVDVTAQSPWTIVDFATDFKAVKMDTKQFGMTINSKDVFDEEGDIAETIPVINGQATQGFTYATEVASQSEATTAHIANAVFTVGWDEMVVVHTPVEYPQSNRTIQYYQYDSAAYGSLDFFLGDESLQGLKVTSVTSSTGVTSIETDIEKLAVDEYGDIINTDYGYGGIDIQGPASNCTDVITLSLENGDFATITVTYELHVPPVAEPVVMESVQYTSAHKLLIVYTDSYDSTSHYEYKGVEMYRVDNPRYQADNTETLINYGEYSSASEVVTNKNSLTCVYVLPIKTTYIDKYSLKKVSGAGTRSVDHAQLAETLDVNNNGVFDEWGQDGVAVQGCKNDVYDVSDPEYGFMYVRADVNFDKTVTQDDFTII